MKNVGKMDKNIRYLLALIFFIAGFLYSPYFYIIAVVLLFTAVIGFCGLYKLLGINTGGRK